MVTPFITLDRLTMVAPLGMQFHDTSSGNLVSNGLIVWAHPYGRPNARTRAIENRKGVYVLHHAFGLRAREHGDGSRFYWDHPDPPNKDFIIEVNDEQRRFQPFQFTASLPIEGIYKWDGALESPLTERSSVPLFSTPMRVAPAGMAIIRADLWDGSSDEPASWAVIEAYNGTRLIAQGIADDKGRIVLVFPYPAPLTFSSASPPGSPPGSPPLATSPPLTEQVWSLELKALYSPVRPVLSPPESTEPLPDLKFTLSQPPATIWADAAQSEVLQETNLRFGRELILKSRPSPASPLSQTRDSVLFITPAVSPP